MFDLISFSFQHRVGTISLKKPIRLGFARHASTKPAKRGAFGASRLAIPARIVFYGLLSLRVASGRILAIPYLLSILLVFNG